MYSQVSGLARGSGVPCFNMGANSGLALKNWWAGGGWGSFADSSGSSIILENVDIVGVGAAQDGGTYYGAHTSATTGGTSIFLKNVQLTGGNVTSTNSANFTASISGPTMTVTGTPTGTLAVGQWVYSNTGATAIATGTKITALGTGTGGAGTYTINPSQTVSSEIMQSGPFNSIGVGVGGSVIANTLVVENSDFFYWMAAMSAPYAGRELISNNTSQATVGPQSIILSTIGGTDNNGTIYGVNLWDEPPVSTLGACGGGTPSISMGVGGGSITVGTGTVTSCSFTRPIVTKTYNGVADTCTFSNSNGIALSFSATGYPATYTITSSTSMAGSTINATCTGPIQ
jgi:hypothetical protein